MKLADFLPRLAAAVIVLLAFWGIQRLARRLLDRTVPKRFADHLAADIVGKLVQYAIAAIGLLMAASQLGFNVVSMLAGLGVAGLALGLAAKDTLANFIAGLILLWDKPFVLGDDVEIGVTDGFVRHIELRSTKLENSDGNDVILPNSEVVARRIVNYTRTSRARVRVPISFAYGVDVERARGLLLPLAGTDDRILAEPEPELVLTELKESAVAAELRFWVDSPRQRHAIRSDFLERAKRALEEAGIEIPAGPHMVVLRERIRELSA